MFRGVRFYREYLKGKDNVAADALSRIEITSEELKSMIKQVISVMTRAQKKRMEAKKQPNDSATKVSNHDWNAQPNMVEILKKPNNMPELSFNEQDYYNIIKKI